MKEGFLLKEAWKARELAYPWKSGTKVGCAILSKDNNVFIGYNIEGLWMTSIHAEVCAISKMVGANERGVAIALVAETEFFTPCGACLDWLVQFCEWDSIVLIQNKYGEIKDFRLGALTPFYPRI